MTIPQLHITHSPPPPPPPPPPPTHTQQPLVTYQAHQNVTDGVVEVRGHQEIEYADIPLGHPTSPPAQEEESGLLGESTCNGTY